MGETRLAMAKKKTTTRRKKAAPKSVGLTADALRTAGDTREVREWLPALSEDGGAVLGTYRDPFGGTPLLWSRCRSIASSRRRISAIRRSRTSSG